MSEKTFQNLGLSPEVLKFIEEAGFTTPTAVQQKAIPEIMTGRDVIACAQTGSGKTAAYLLPIINSLMTGRARARMPRALVLIPTRELAQQVVATFDKFTKNHNLKCTIIIGGEFIGGQEKELEKGIDVLIATPGRLLDIIERGKVMLLDTKTLVIDEADKMMDMGFFPAIEKLLSFLPPKRQNIFLSATMPESIKLEAHKLLKDPIEVIIERDTQHIEAIDQQVILTTAKTKRSTLEKVLKNNAVKNAIIFCNRKVSAGNLYAALKKEGFKVGMLHGDMPQTKRTETLAEFKSGVIKFLVASDVAARGIDVKSLSHVINYDVPMNTEDYTHRIGRTGRAGRRGVAITFVLPQEEAGWNLIQSEVGADPKQVHKLKGPKSRRVVPPLPEPEREIIDLHPAKPHNKPGFGDDLPAFLQVSLTKDWPESLDK